MEDDSYKFLFITAVIAVCIGLFLGVSTLLRKSFATIPEPEPSTSIQMLREQRDRIKETEERRKQMMDMQKQRMKDMRR
jgi:hypothetical protein